MIKRHLWLSLTLIGIVFALVHNAAANVSIKTGNFFIGYTDVIYSGGFEPKVERIYNSKAPFKGIFGWGWGSEYEVYLETEPDGSVVVHEYGGGADNVFLPINMDRAAIDEVVSQASAAAERYGIFGSTADAKAYADRLHNDMTYRNDEVRKWRECGLMVARSLSVGSVLTSNRFSHQTIMRTNEGFERDFDNGRRELFDAGGKLVRIYDKNGNYVALDYDGTGKMVRLVDNFGRSMELQYDINGQVIHVIDGQHRVASYQYNDMGELVRSEDVDHNVYTYAYDVHYNLLRIGYTDNTTMEIAYWGLDQLENVRSVKERDGTLTTYDYNNHEPNRKLVTIRIFNHEKQEISRTIDDYRIQRDELGHEWTQRLITTVDGYVTDTVYAQGSGLPLSIRQYPEGREEKAETTTFEYDDKGHVVRKETPSEITKLEYDSAAGKVRRVENTNKLTNISTWSKFSYDDRANLVTAEDSDGQHVTLKYDSVGRISQLEGNDGTIEFEYNRNSKPTVIRLVGTGEIHVSYQPNGEIDKVDSGGDRRIALKVTSSFQRLLDIIRPAGVSLSF